MWMALDNEASSTSALTAISSGKMDPVPRFVDKAKFEIFEKSEKVDSSRKTK